MLSPLSHLFSFSPAQSTRTLQQSKKPCLVLSCAHAIASLCDKYVHQDQLPSSLQKAGNPNADLIVRFWSLSVPDVSLESYLARIFKMTHAPTSVLAMAVIFLQRAKNKGFPLNAFTVHRLTLMCVASAAKYVSDITSTNKRFAAAGGVCLKEFNCLELDLLFFVGFDLFVCPEEYETISAALHAPPAAHRQRLGKLSEPIIHDGSFFNEDSVASETEDDVPDVSSNSATMSSCLSTTSMTPPSSPPPSQMRNRRFRGRSRTRTRTHPALHHIPTRRRDSTPSRISGGGGRVNNSSSPMRSRSRSSSMCSMSSTASSHVTSRHIEATNTAAATATAAAAGDDDYDTDAYSDSEIDMSRSHIRVPCTRTMNPGFTPAATPNPTPKITSVKAGECPSLLMLTPGAVVPNYF
jgi:Cyclin